MENKLLKIQILEDQKKKNDLDNFEINKQLDILKDEPFKYLFRLNTEFGEQMERVCEEIIFKNILRIKNDSHDLKIINLPEGVTDPKIESKAFRVLSKKTKNKVYYDDRAISLYDSKIGYCSKKKIYRRLKSTQTFQQIKPTKANIFICIAVFSNGLDVFILKSDKHFTKLENCVGVKEEGKCYITGQHEGNLTEGQVSINDEVMLNNYKFSIIGKDDKLYYFDRDNKKILEEFEKIDITKYL
jgi:hypothetical protein